MTTGLQMAVGASEIVADDRQHSGEPVLALSL